MLHCNKVGCNLRNTRKNTSKKNSFRVFLPILVATLILISPLHADWSLQSLFINKIPLKADIKADIKRFFVAQIQASKYGLSCFPKASTQQLALQCAKAMDKIIAQKMQAPELLEMQKRVKKVHWDTKQRHLLINEIRLNMKHHQQATHCISRATTMGDLNRCFPND